MHGLILLIVLIANILAIKGDCDTYNDLCALEHGVSAPNGNEASQNSFFSMNEGDFMYFSAQVCKISLVSYVIY